MTLTSLTFAKAKTKTKTKTKVRVASARSIASSVSSVHAGRWPGVG
ncbi:hypothetical protein [Pseudomonas syringae group genomosp. 3]|uniref:Uncharacterized protein n=1 Tax=Pseudomonas syringae pv. tomato (strain ATCC BAA-871 / DC3000) TaxID=223283 RepID=Q88BI4_PSESM|nr:hypothetical protein [Pseudomonas syringae group genomosp. 3]AAO53580.1 protein of unknown function [Pseudomonas syringae pv. tomato str. DC3000]KPB95231.1 Uncharacterized protein AC502_2728 [Pseudomonas syringae pv. maculicola]